MSPDLSQKNIGELESLRGLAALLVVMFHAPGWNSGKEFINFVANGYLMVDLFFVLSGFVIYRAYGSRLVNAEEVWRFQFLRLARLYPVHLLFFIFFVVTTATPFWETHWDAFFEQLFLLQAIGPTGNAITFNYPAWSISVEFYTYLIFALIIWILPVRKVWMISALTILALMGLLTEYTFGFADLLRCWSGFFMGCLCAQLVDNVSWKWPSWSSLVAFIFLGLFLQFKPSKNWDCLIYVLSSLLILTLFFTKKNVVKQILNLPLLIWVGEISYSLYMAQLAVIYLSTEFLARAWRALPLISKLQEYLGISFLDPHTGFEIMLRFIAFFLLLFLVSWLSYVWVERPCRLWSRRIAHAPRLRAPY